MGDLTLLSGGQTGVDRGALDAARSLGIAAGGWVPAGRLAEDGHVPDRYGGLRETSSADTSERTRRNVADADALLLVLRGPVSGGTRVALDTARALGRPVLELDLARCSEDEAAEALEGWLGGLSFPLRLNVAGPRESEAPGIGEACRRVLEMGLERFR